MSVVMWEAVAADGMADDLVRYAKDHADPVAQIYRSRGPRPRVVVIDPTGRGLAEVPDHLLDRPPHAWTFEPVER